MNALVIRQMKDICHAKYLLWIVFLIILCWQVSLPPFQFKVMFDSAILIDFYLMVLSTAGLLCLFLMQDSSPLKQQLYSCREILATKTSPKTYFWGLYFSLSYTVILTLLVPLLLTSFIQQYIYAPDHVEFNSYLFAFLGHIFSFQFLVLFLMLLIRIYIIDDIVAISLFLLSQVFLHIISLITGMNVYNSCLILQNLCSFLWNPEYFLYILLWCLSLITIISVVNYGLTDSLFRRNIAGNKTSVLTKFARKYHMHISGHHLEIMRVVSHQRLSVILLLILIGLIIINRLFHNQLIPAIELYLIFVIPFALVSCQFIIFNMDRDAGMKENIILKTKAYISIIWNRWFLLVLIQVFVHLICIILVHMYSHAVTLTQMYYMILTGIFISIINLCLYILLRSGMLTMVTLTGWIYLQLNENIRYLIDEYTSVPFIIFIWRGHDSMTIYSCLIIIFKILVLTCVAGILIHYSRYAQSRIVY